MISRQIYNISTSSSAVTDTGPSTNGALLQMRWNPTTVDTGGDLVLTVMPKGGDTGDGWEVFNDNDCLGANFVRAPRQQMHDEAGLSDTGVAPILLAGDRIQVKIIPGGAAVAGRLYLYFLE
jgi:hypothetical protein